MKLDWLWQNIVGGIAASIAIWIIAKLYSFLSGYFPRFRWVIDAWKDLLIKYGLKIYLPVLGIVAISIFTGWIIGNYSAPRPVVTLIGEPVPLDKWDTFVQDRIGQREKVDHGVIKSDNVNGWQTDVITATAVYLSNEKIADKAYRRNLVFEWPDPLKDIPYSGIIARIYVEPNSKNEENKIFCNFESKYIITGGNEVSYFGNANYIPYNKWTTMVWEFSGVFYPADTDNWKSTSVTLTAQLDKLGHGFNAVVKRTGEQMLYDAVSSKKDNVPWDTRVKSIKVKCYVSADLPYTDLPKTEFTGNFSLSTVRVLPVNYPGLP